MKVQVIYNSTADSQTLSKTILWLLKEAEYCEYSNHLCESKHGRSS